jgi:hypothetical protein
LGSDIDAANVAIPSPRRPGGERRRTAKGRRRHRRRILRRARNATLVVLGLFLLLGTLVVRDALEVRRALVDVRAELGATRNSLASADVGSAASSFAEAEESARRAESLTRGVVWRAASVFPVIGRSTGTMTAIVGVGVAAVDVVEPVVGSTEGPLASISEISVADGRLALEPVSELSAVLGRLPLEQLIGAHDRLDARSTWMLPAPLADARRDALELADATIATLERARDALGALPGFLGVEGPRRYLLGMQTPAELRGTGGLLAYYAEVTADDGRLSLGESDAQAEATEPETGYLFDQGTRGEPVPTGEEFERRYGHTTAASNFQNVNFDPDLPTTSRVLLDLYEARTGDRLDGVILVDPVALGLVLEPIGSVSLPADVLDGEGRLPAELEAGQVADVLMRDVYEVYGDGRSQERRQFLRTVADSAFDAIFAGGWELPSVAERLAVASAGRHLQLYSRDEDEQSAFGALDVAGQIRSEDQRSDLLAVTANSAVGGKQDPYMDHAFEADLALGQVSVTAAGATVAARRGTVRVNVTNGLPDTQIDPYILGRCVAVLGESTCSEVPDGRNRTWFTLWSPESSWFDEPRAQEGTLPSRVTTIGGQRALDAALDTPIHQSRSFEVGLDGDVELERRGAELVYRLSWWRQAKANSDRLDLKLAAPHGWYVSEVEASGGAADPDTGSELEVESSRTGIRVHGEVTADVDVEVRMARPWMDRLRDWWRAPVW